MKHKIVLLLTALLIGLNAFAQRYSYRANLPDVHTAGFYKVVLTPEVTAYSMTTLQDVRIKDADGRDVPYVSNTDVMISRGGFHTFKILSMGKGADAQTHILLQNDAAEPIEALLLQIRNSDARRTASVSGSKDGKTFYSLRDSIQLEIAHGMHDTGLCTLPLPRTSYPFLRLTIFDKSQLPLEILGAGILNEDLLRQQYQEVPAPIFTQTDSNNHKTYIHVKFSKPYTVERLVLLFNYVPFYKRSARLYVDGQAPIYFTAEYPQPASVWAELHTTEALLVIDNEDNPPLQLKTVTAWQQRKYLLAYFDPGIAHSSSAYTLNFGDSALSAPLYDLRFFKDSMAKHALQELRPDSMERVQVVAAQSSTSKPFIGKGLMWTIIVIVLAGLIAATAGLIRQIKQ